MSVAKTRLRRCAPLIEAELRAEPRCCTATARLLSFQHDGSAQPMGARILRECATGSAQGLAPGQPRPAMVHLSNEVPGTEGLLKKLEQMFGFSVRREPGRVYIEAPRSKQPD
jgi:hypothetical protein